ncbi:class I SAM-dependent methyltransferase [Ignatzschineria sp. LJL83]
MKYPFEIKKKGQENVSELPSNILEKLDLSFVETENRFVWDGKSFYWNDLEAGHLDIDFFSKKMRYRMQHINKAQEPLLRALGWKSTESKRVLDMTAGLGRDSCLLFFAGFHVTMFERNPVLQILLQNALEALPSADFSSTIKLEKEDSIVFLQKMKKQQTSLDSSSDSLLDSSEDESLIADAIYMDPMYPERKKSALVKKELRIIRNLVGSDMDSEQLLLTALESKVQRVVVKRPKGATYVADLVPNHSVESPNTRFDVYLTQL